MVDEDRYELEMKHAALERMLIQEYLINKGYPPERLKELPVEEAKKLKAEAARYASSKLAERENRASMLRGIKNTSKKA